MNKTRMIIGVAIVAATMGATRAWLLRPASATAAAPALEEPAPMRAGGVGIDSMYQEGTDAALNDRVQRPRP